MALIIIAAVALFGGSIYLGILQNRNRARQEKMDNFLLKRFEESLKSK